MEGTSSTARRHPFVREMPRSLGSSSRGFGDRVIRPTTESESAAGQAGGIHLGTNVWWTRLDALSTGSRFAVAAVVVAVCVGLGYLAEPSSSPSSPSATLYLAVALASLIGGHWPGLFATAIGAAVTFTRTIAPEVASVDESLVSRGTLGLPVFIVTGVLMSLAGGTLRHARRRARLVEARLELMADNAPFLMWLAGPDRSGAWFNQAWLRFRGRTSAQEQGEGWLAGIHDEDRQRCLDVFNRASRDGAPFEVEYRLRRHDGEHRWIVCRGVPIIGEYDEVAGFVGSCIDVHDRFEAERERERLLTSERAARAEAERANQAKEEFLGIVSHELRTPLTAILGWTYLLREQIDSPSERRHALTVIERNARAQAEIVDDLLDMSRLMAGTLRFQREVVDIVLVAREAVNNVHPSAVARDLTVDTALPDTPLRVLGDAQRLQQVLANLLSNAVKFTPAGGRIVTTVRQNTAGAQIIVSDTGHGISPEFLPQVFDRFRQADASRTRRHGGLGIGLALVKGIVQQHGGTIIADSPGPGAGATFTVTLPVPNDVALRAFGVHGFDATTVTRPLHALRVLVVDDDPDTCELLRRVLEDYGASVATATSVQDALSRWEARPPDVLVSDISMPDQDGYSLVREIRRKPADRGGAVPAIALTAFGRAEDQRAALEAGFQLHLRKPVEPYELVRRVAALGRLNAA
jgi:PAS domain S-box-containing protein